MNKTCLFPPSSNVAYRIAQVSRWACHYYYYYYYQLPRNLVAFPKMTRSSLRAGYLSGSTFRLPVLSRTPDTGHLPGGIDSPWQLWEPESQKLYKLLANSIPETKRRLSSLLYLPPPYCKGPFQSRTVVDDRRQVS